MSAENTKRRTISWWESPVCAFNSMSRLCVSVFSRTELIFVCVILLFCYFVVQPKYAARIGQLQEQNEIAAKFFPGRRSTCGATAKR